MKTVEGVRRSSASAISRPGSVWLIASGSAAGRIDAALDAAGVTPVRGDTEPVIGLVGAGDWVVLDGLAPEAATTTAERLLARGARVALDLSAWPALGRVVGQPFYGVDCCVLDPGGPGAVDRVLTRTRDVLLAGLCLLVLAPILAILAVLIKRSSPGPVLYRTSVVGRGGRFFVWRKLRTMRVGTPEDDARRKLAYAEFIAGTGPRQTGNAPVKVVDVSRVTPIGSFLRRHSLDELPQLWNVLRGEMTLVGPRPCLPYEFELLAPWQRLRYRVTPGLTGPWQAYGRSRMSLDEMALLDYCYSRYRSFWFDGRVILKTARVVITGEGGR